MPIPLLRMNSSSFTRLCVAAMLATGIHNPNLRAQGQPAKPAEKPKPTKKWDKMDYGVFLSSSIEAPWPPGNITNKGIVIKLGKEQNAVVCFDTDALRMASGWTGGWLNTRGVAFDGAHGPSPSVQGHMVFGTKPGPGWANGGAFADPRHNGFGPIPAEWAKYRGLYLNGDRVVLSYTVGGAEVLELPGVEEAGDVTAITRTIQIGKSSTPLTLLVTEAQAEGASGSVAMSGQPGAGQQPNSAQGHMAVVLDAPANPDSRTVVGIIDPPAGATWEVGPPPRGDQHAGVVGVMLKIPPLAAPATFKLVIWNGTQNDVPKFAGHLRQMTKAEDLRALCKGGPSHWTQKIETKGELGKSTDPYVVDTIAIPFENPWDSWMRTGGFDFFSDGRTAAVCTWSGDVWIVSGIDDKLDHLQWKRFATGLFQPLGLKIVDDQIYVHGRDQITRLHDLNGDGEADFYENFNNDIQATPGFHEFAFDLHTDSQGNFYIAKAGPVKPGGRGFQTLSDHNGTILKISKDGKHSEVFATGLRAPNGFCVGPGDVVTTGDNEGTWVPTSYVAIVRPGGYLGVADTAHRPDVPKTGDSRICWIPHNSGVDNSCGGQAWVPDDRWGPFKGYLLHLSYGKSSLFLVPTESVDDTIQGGVVKLPLKFDSGIMRARFNKVDGQLYVCGLKGWQTNAVKDGCFQRVRYTGKPVKMPNAVHVTDRGIHVGFTAPLDPKTAGDAQNYSIEQWNYKWTSNYGSPEVSVKEPGRTGHDPVEIKSAKVEADGKGVFLEVPGLAPVMQMKIKFGINAGDGTPMSYEIYNTINKVGTESALGGQRR
jgi:uncharacterized protein DUF6797